MGCDSQTARLTTRAVAKRLEVHEVGGVSREKNLSVGGVPDEDSREPPLESGMEGQLRLVDCDDVGFRGVVEGISNDEEA
jgi:hypothetical protein